MACLNLVPTLSFSQNFLEIPIKLEVEKGDMDGVVVKVKKDGKDAFTQSGASKMRLKLDFGKKYTLIFTKNGYITKTIEVNTKAPSARIAQGFDPYRIGVKLFLNDTQNSVMYNQPVAQIKYDQNLDEFNFETDYSKSVLSAMNTEDDNPKKDSSTITLANNDVVNTPLEPAVNTNAPTSTSADKPIANKNENLATTITKKDDFTASGGGEKKKRGKANNSNSNKKSSSKVSTGRDEKKLAKGKSGFDLIKKRSVNSGQDKQEKNLPYTATDDKQPVLSTEIGGSEYADNVHEHFEDEKITREDIVERNRVITKVKVKKGDSYNEYSRVNYNWGGKFYFKNDKTSIPENLFVQWTGVDN